MPCHIIHSGAYGNRVALFTLEPLDQSLHNFAFAEEPLLSGAFPTQFVHQVHTPYVSLDTPGKATVQVGRLCVAGGSPCAGGWATNPSPLSPVLLDG